MMNHWKRNPDGTTSTLPQSQSWTAREMLLRQLDYMALNANWYARNGAEDITVTENKPLEGDLSGRKLV